MQPLWTVALNYYQRARTATPTRKAILYARLDATLRNMPAEQQGHYYEGVGEIFKKEAEVAQGKYADVIDKLPAWDHEEPSYQAKIDAKKREIYNEIGEALSSSAIATLYRNTRLEKDVLEEELYATDLELAAISQMLVDRYEIDGITSTTLDTGEKVAIQYEPYAVVEDKEKIWQWCKDNGYEREMQLHWKTLNAITKERLLQGQPEPDGVRAFSHVKPKFYKG